MYQIEINNARFFVGVGLYPEEKVLKNEIILDLKLAYKTLPEGVDYIDYVQVYELAEKCILKSPETLEEILYDIRDTIYDTYEGSILEVKLCKLNPPIPGEIEKVCVQWSDF